jgi:hypothetical protein
MAYLQELLSLNDITVRQAKAQELCSTRATINNKYGGFDFFGVVYKSIFVILFIKDI